MSFFRQPRPRPFRHRMLYVDERRERLKEIEQRARRELSGETESQAETDMESQSSHAQRLHHAFHTSRMVSRPQRTGYSFFFNTLLLLLIVFVLCVCWNLLIS